MGQCDCLMWTCQVLTRCRHRKSSLFDRSHNRRYLLLLQLLLSQWEASRCSLLYSGLPGPRTPRTSSMVPMSLMQGKCWSEASKLMQVGRRSSCLMACMLLPHCFRGVFVQNVFVVFLQLAFVNKSQRDQL